MNLLYTESSFGLNHFIELKRLKEKQQGSQLVHLKEKLKNALDKNNADELNIREINDFLILSNESSEQDLACSAFKLYLKENYLKSDKNFGELLVKSDYLLNKTCDKAIALLNDKSIQPSLMTQITTFALMIKFYNAGQHDQVCDCFFKYLDHLDKQEQKNELKPFKFKLKSQRQLIPFGHLRLVSASLLKLNSADSFLKMRKTLELASRFNSHLNNTSLASCFLLSLNRNELDTARNLLSRITTSNKTLKLNLEAILCCYENQLEQAVGAIESVISLRPHSGDEFHGKLFNLTLVSFKQLIARTTSINSNTNATASKQQNIYSELIIRMNNRLFKLDLDEYCTLVHTKFNKKINLI